MVIDIDDGVVASYNLVKSAGSWSSQTGASQVVRAFGGGTARLSDTPSSWLQAESGALGSVPNMALGVGAAAAMVPFAGLSIRSGTNAVRRARKRHGALKQVRAATQQELGSLATGAAPAGSSVQVADRPAVHIAEQSLHALDTALRHNRYDGTIGMSYLATGGLTLARSAEDTAVLGVGLSAVHNPAFAVAAAPALSMMASVAGIIGTFALTPLAAAFSVVLGSVVFHQARRTGKELQAADRLFQRTAAIRKAVAALPHQAYHALIECKLRARLRFATRLKRWAAGYLTGTTLWALATAGKVLLGAAALVGLAAVLTNPVGLALITVVAVAGGVAMTLGSWQFIRLRGKNLRQQSYRLQESPFLSRKLDALHTACCLRSGAAADAPPGVLIGEEAALRAALYDFVRERDRLRQCLLHRIAHESGKSRRWERRSDDAPVELPAPTRPRRRLNDLGAALGCAHVWLRHVVAGGGLAAARAATLQRYAQRSEELTTTGLASWLEHADEAQDAGNLLRECLLGVLRAQKEYLDAKLTRTRSICDGALQQMSAPARKLFAELLRERQADEARLNHIARLLAEDGGSLRSLEGEFLRAQETDSASPAEGSGAALSQRLARYLLAGLREQYSATRGILFDMHRRALDLQQRMRAEGGG